jgi:hypothetical protein
MLLEKLINDYTKQWGEELGSWQDRDYIQDELRCTKTIYKNGKRDISQLKDGELTASQIALQDFIVNEEHSLAERAFLENCARNNDLFLLSLLDKIQMNQEAIVKDTLYDLEKDIGYMEHDVGRFELCFDQMAKMDDLINAELENLRTHTDALNAQFQRVYQMRRRLVEQYGLSTGEYEREWNGKQIVRQFPRTPDQSNQLRMEILPIPLTD